MTHSYFSFSRSKIIKTKHNPTTSSLPPSLPHSPPSPPSHTDDFLLPGMGMMSYGDEDEFGAEDMFPGGMSSNASVATNDNDDSTSSSSNGRGGYGKGNGEKMASASFKQAAAAAAGETGDSKAAAVVRQAATRTRSGITTRLGGMRGGGQFKPSVMLPSAASAHAAASQPSRAKPMTKKQQHQQQVAVMEVEEEEEEEDEDETGSEDEEGGEGPGRGRRKKAKLTLKPLTEAQRVERRERNREHAKRSRMRKKFMLESLQAQMLALRKENLRLRQLVATKIPDKADTILRGCSSIKTQSMLSPVELGHHRALADSDGKLISALQFAQQNFTVSDPSLPDNRKSSLPPSLPSLPSLPRFPPTNSKLRTYPPLPPSLPPSQPSSTPPRVSWT